MKTALVLKALVLCSLALGMAEANSGCGRSSGCDICQRDRPLPLVRPKVIKPPAPVVYRTVYREEPVETKEVERSCERNVRVPSPSYSYDTGRNYAPAPSCRSEKSYSYDTERDYAPAPSSRSEKSYSYDTGRDYAPAPSSRSQTSYSCDSGREYVPAPARASAPSCRSQTSCRTKNVVEVVKTYEPRYHLRSRPVKECTTCRTCQQPARSCSCARK